LVPLGFESDDLAESFTANGFRFDRRAVFVWEAVTSTHRGRRAAHSGGTRQRRTGSRLLFTFVRRVVLDGTHTYDAEGAYRDFVVRHRVWHFGLDRDQVDPLLGEYGWVEDEQVGAAGYRRRYLEPAGRDLPVSELERFVAATKP
jgi:O-methyltransferase involved in polyketide biosynthesis